MFVKLDQETEGFLGDIVVKGTLSLIADDSVAVGGPMRDIDAMAKFQVVSDNYLHYRLFHRHHCLLMA